MNLFRKLHSQRTPPGMERSILRSLPKVLLIGMLIPLSLAVGRRWLPVDGTEAEIAKAIGTVDILAIAIAATVLTAVVTVAVGCVLVIIMKGPAYVADAYELRDANRPADKDKPPHQ